MRTAALIRCGRLCQKCSASHCTEKDAIEIECPACDGHGCEHCEDGFFVIDGCPKAFVGSEIVSAVTLANIAQSNNLLPHAGGVLDQSAWFIAFWQAMTSEESSIRSEKNG